MSYKRSDLSNVQFHILVMDDDAKFVEKSLKIVAKRKDYNLFLWHEQSLQKALRFIESEDGNSISGVILDVVCPDGETDKPSNKTFEKAIDEFSRRTKLPLFGLTAETDEIEPIRSYSGRRIVGMYDKFDDLDRLCKDVRNSAIEYRNTKIRLKYKDVFEVIDKYTPRWFPEEIEQNLIKCLTGIEKMRTHEVVMFDLDDIGTKMRNMIDQLFFALHKLAPELVPDPTLKFSEIMEHLKGGKYNAESSNKNKRENPSLISSFVQQQLYLVYRGTSDVVAHWKEGQYKPSPYTGDCFLYNLLELILWFKTEAEKRGD